MALRDQPYMPLYVQDFLTDEKLMECSPAATGIYIRIMCIMHKSDPYGKILLKQKDKQTSDSSQNFANKLARFMPYTSAQIQEGLAELLAEGVLQIKNDELIQKRMVRDNELSIIRSEAGSKGGFAKAKSEAKQIAKEIANTENEIENEIEDQKKEEVQEKGETDRELKIDFDTFRRSYPGNKKGFDAEFENFKKKNPDWRNIVPVLLPRLKYQIEARRKKALQGGFIPEWRYLSTWINQKCWTEEIAVDNIGATTKGVEKKDLSPKTHAEMLNLVNRDSEIFKKYTAIVKPGERQAVYYLKGTEPKTQSVASVN